MSQTVSLNKYMQKRMNVQANLWHILEIKKKYAGHFVRAKQLDGLNGSGGIGPILGLVKKKAPQDLFSFKF